MISTDSKIIKLCSSREAAYLRLLFIAITGLIAYSNTFQMSFNFDDIVNIVNNPVVKEFNVSGFKQALQSRRAFGIFTFQLNYFISGTNVIGYHLVNIFIHISAGFLVYALITLLLSAPYFKSEQEVKENSLSIPFISALLFVVHPVQTQAVTYIVQRFASLATLLVLASIVCYLRGRVIQHSSERSFCAECGWFAAALLAGLLAFYTKEIAYTLPVVIVLVEFAFFDLKRAKIIGLVVAALSSITIILVKFSSGYIAVDNIISKLDDITRIQTITSRSDYFLTQLRVIVTYIRLLLFPVNQSVDYDYALSHSFLEWRVFASFLLILTMICFALWLIFAYRGGNKYLRLSAFGILWFFLTLSVESSVLPIIDLIFEHRVYLPSVGFIMAVSSFGLSLGWRYGSLNISQKVLLGFLSIALVLAGATWKRNLVWTNDKTLWEDATAKKPGSARAWNNFGGALIKQREGKKALFALIKSIELDPSKPDAWNNLGIAIDLLGVYKDRFNRTAEVFKDPRAIEDRVVSRWLGEVNNSLGLAYEITGNFPKAAENYRNAAGYSPSLGIAYFNLAIVSAGMGDYRTIAEQQQILWLVDPVLAERLKSRLSGLVPTD